jgi:hypothetical protein
VLFSGIPHASFSCESKRSASFFYYIPKLYATPGNAHQNPNTTSSISHAFFCASPILRHTSGLLKNSQTGKEE